LGKEQPIASQTRQSSLDEEKPKAARAQRGAAREAILAALDHGSHTVGELVVVTAMSAPNLTGNLRRLVSDGTIVKTEREGKTAYALPTA
jgi:DNA-binding transcriptional ArsR family regulator